MGFHTYSWSSYIFTNLALEIKFAIWNFTIDWQTCRIYANNLFIKSAICLPPSCCLKASIVVLVLDRAHVISNLSFIGFQNVEFEHTLSSKINYFLSLRLSILLSFSSFGSSNMNISGHSKFEFIENPNHGARV